MAEYSIFIRPDLLQRFWQVMADGGFITDAVAVIETSRRTGRRVLAEAGGVRPRRGRGLKGRCLTLGEREEIALGRAAGESMRSIADRLERSAATISRELERNLDRQGRYRATAAHALAYGRASRPKPAKLVTNLVLREKVEQDLEKKYSPEQITGRLRREFPDDPEMRVSPETIYHSIYVQSRGALRREALTGSIPDNAQGWRILYSTKTSTGAPAVGSGFVLAPKQLPAGPRPVVLWTHGTVGIAPSCAPSLFKDVTAGVPSVQQALAHGWVMVAPDYVGMGTKGPTPYLIGAGQAYSALDAARAAHQLSGLSLSEQTVV